MNPRLVVVVCIGFIAACIVSCNEDTTGPEGSPSDVAFPDSNVSYEQHVRRLFNQTCALGGCHDDGPHQSALRLTSWGSTVIDVPGVVVPGDPDNSTLVLRIEGRLGVRMPLNRNPLNQNQTNGIRKWVAEGAENN